MSDETPSSDGGAVVEQPTLWNRWENARGNERTVVGMTAIIIGIFPYVFAEMPVVSDFLQGYQSLTSLILIWGIFAIGFDLLLGYTGLLSFGHAAFWGGAAYAAGLFSQYVVGEPIMMVIVGTVFAVILAWVMGFLSLRRGGIYFSILTLAFAQMLFYVSSSPIAGLTGGENGFTQVSVEKLLFAVDLGMPLPVVGDWLYVFIGTVTVVCVAAAYRLLNSPYGMVFRAIRENEQRAEFVGLNVWRYKLMAFIISGAFAGVAGSLYTIHGSYVPLESLYWTTSGEIVIMTVLGGTGSLFGPLLGAGLYLYVENIVSGLPVIGPFWHLILGLVFVVVIWLFPRGIWGGINDLRWFLNLAVNNPKAAKEHAITKAKEWLAALKSVLVRLVTWPKRVFSLVSGGERQ